MFAQTESLWALNVSREYEGPIYIHGSILMLSWIFCVLTLHDHVLFSILFIGKVLVQSLQERHFLRHFVNLFTFLYKELNYCLFINCPMLKICIH